MKISRSILSISLSGVVAAVFLSLAAGCGGGGGGGSSMGPPPPPPASAKPAVHINFFGTANGSINSGATFGTVSGFTQQQHAQVLGLSPGAQIIIRNNDSVTHTFNVFGGSFPAPGSAPATDTTANANGGVLGPGYRSGMLAAGQSTGLLTVTPTAGNLYIICAIHYTAQVPHMQDGLVVQVGQAPGPQATPMPVPSGGGCHGYGC